MLTAGDQIWWDDGVIEPRLVRLMDCHETRIGYVVRFRLGGVLTVRTLPAWTIPEPRDDGNEDPETSTDPVSVLSWQDHPRWHGDTPDVLSTSTATEQVS